MELEIAQEIDSHREKLSLLVKVYFEYLNVIKNIYILNYCIAGCHSR